MGYRRLAYRHRPILHIRGIREGRHRRVFFRGHTSTADLRNSVYSPTILRYTRLDFVLSWKKNRI